jgi:hypothetical protein
VQWREGLQKARTVAVKALVGLSAFVLLYVGYAHLVSAVTMPEYRLKSYDERLDSLASLGRFDLTERGGLTHELRDGVVRVRGTAAASGPTATVRFLGPAQRLDDLVTTKLRFRARNAGAYDVFVGLQRADADPSDLDARRILAVARNGSKAPFAIEGDASASGARHIAPRVTPLANGLLDGGAPTPEPGATTTAGPHEEWHEISLAVAAYVRGVFATYDGAPVASQVTQWWMGTRVRLVFGVIAREPGALVDVELAQASYEQSERPSTLPPFTDRFRGKVLDPRLWLVTLPDGIKAESAYRVDPALGLLLRSRSLGEKGFQPAITLLSPPTPLESFSLKARLEVHSLKRGAFVIGIIGSGYSPARFYDLGVKGNENGDLEAIAVGHWSGDGQLGVDHYPGRWTAGEGTLAMTYDARRGTIVASINGRSTMDHTLDLLPGDSIELRVGATLEGPDAVADLVVREVAFDRATILPIP